MRLAQLGCITLLVAGLLTGCNESKYSTEDAVAVYGEGRFQIGRIYPRAENMHLTDWRDGGGVGDVILEVVFDWREKGDWVYAYGKSECSSKSRSYVVLNHKTALWTKFERLADVPNEHRAEAARLWMTWLPAQETASP